MFLLIFYTFLVCFSLILTIIIYHQVLFFFRVHTDIDKDADCLQSNNNDSLNDLWLLFATLFFFLKVWLNNRNNIKLRLLVTLIVSVLLFLPKHSSAFCCALGQFSSTPKNLTPKFQAKIKTSFPFIPIFNNF